MFSGIIAQQVVEGHWGGLY